MEKFKAETDLKSPNFIRKMEKLCRSPKFYGQGNFNIYRRRDEKSKELRQRLEILDSRRERIFFKKTWGPKVVSEELRNLSRSGEEDMSLRKFAQICAPEFQSVDNKQQFWNNANLAVIKAMVRNGAVLKTKDGKVIEIADLKS